MSRRTERVNALLREEISALISRDIKDPRLSGLTSITKVEVSPDLRRARVFVSNLETEESESALIALRSAAPFIRRQLNQRIDLRHVPELSFHADDSIRRGAELTSMIHDLNKEEER